MLSLIQLSANNEGRTLAANGGFHMKFLSCVRHPTWSKGILSTTQSDNSLVNLSRLSEVRASIIPHALLANHAHFISMHLHITYEHIDKVCSASE